MYGVANALEVRFFPGAGQAEVANNIFDDHDRAIDNHAEIQRAERKEVSGNFVQVETDGSKEQGEWDGHGDNERAADIAQEEK